MSLYGDDDRYIYGAVRNVELAQLYFPGWTVRFYVEKPIPDVKSLYPLVPKFILNKLRSMGAQIIEVDSKNIKIGKIRIYYRNRHD